jgi:hypothetical protein
MMRDRLYRIHNITFHLAGISLAASRKIPEIEIGNVLVHSSFKALQDASLLSLLSTTAFILRLPFCHSGVNHLAVIQTSLDMRLDLVNSVSGPEESDLTLRLAKKTICAENNRTVIFLACGDDLISVWKAVQLDELSVLDDHRVINTLHHYR